MENFVSIFQTVGIWGLIIIVVLWMIYERHKAKISKEAKKTDNQNAIDLQKVIAEHDEKMINTIVSRISGGPVHTVEDEERNCRLNEYLGESLQSLLEKTGAHRAFIFSYHNGEKSIDGRGYQKMSCTNEKTVSWVSPIMGSCQNLQRAMLPSIYKTLISKDCFFVKDIETLKESDAVAYDFIKKHGTKSVFLHSLKRGDGLVTGFVGIEYVSSVSIDMDIISEYLTQNALKITGAVLGDNSGTQKKAGD